MKTLWQDIQRELNLPPDGIPGGNTAAAVAQRLGLRKTSRPPREFTGTWPQDTGDQSELVRFFGEKGQHQAMVELPFPMGLTWDYQHKLTKFSCHERVAPAVLRIFQKTLDHYGLAKVQHLNLDRFSGCLNVRKKRGGSTWSTHAWGIAIDLNDTANRFGWDHSKAQFARPDYVPFWEIVESEGAVSLGRERDFDWMHFQFARL